jgi:hypothetical protein
MAIRGIEAPETGVRSAVLSMDKGMWGGIDKAGPPAHLRALSAKRLRVGRQRVMFSRVHPFRLGLIYQAAGF